MKSHRLLILNIGLFLSLCAPAAWPTTWQSAGPDGGPVSALVFAPSDSLVAYAGSFLGGVFRSHDGGKTWTAANGGLSFPGILSLAVDPHNPALAYAGTPIGIYRTMSGGASWQALPLGTPETNFGVTTIRIDPDHPRILYAATQSGVFRSADGGSHWVERDAGLVGNLLALEIDPDHPGTLYAGVFSDADARIYKTTNGGGRWSVLPGLRPSFVEALVVQHSALYVATLDGIFVSHDGGTIWNQSSHRNDLFQLVGTSSGVLYGAFYPAGVLRSADGGRTWNDPAPHSSSLAATQILAIAPDSLGDRVLVANDAGLFTLNSGAGWKPVNHGPRSSYVSSLAVTATNPSLLFASTQGQGVFVRGNGGDFTPRNTGLPQSASHELLTYGLLYSPSAPRSVRIGLETGAVAKTSDAGLHWTSGPPAICLPATVTGFSPPSTIFVSSTASTSDAACSASCVTKVSRDNGASFTCLDGPPRVSAFLVDPVQPATVYAADGDAVWKSTDGGLHFTLLASQLGVSISALAASPAAHETLFAGGFEGVLKSVDGGQTWRLSPGRVFGTHVLAVDPSNPAVVYANGLLAQNGRFVDRVFASRDGGASWTLLGDGFPLSVSTALSLDSAHHTLYVGTQGAGVWALDLP